MPGIDSDEVSLLPWSQGVHLRVPLEPRQREVVRAVAASIALREEFTLDQVADLRVIVDEIFDQLAKVASPASMLRCFFTDTEEGLTLHAFVFAEPGATVPMGTVGHYVLSELTDNVRYWESKRQNQQDLSQCHVEVLLSKEDKEKQS